MCQAYQQLHVTNSMAAISTIKNNKLLYAVRILPFRNAAAPAIFQRTIETRLSGIPGVSVYLEFMSDISLDRQYTQIMEFVVSETKQLGAEKFFNFTNLFKCRCSITLTSLISFKQGRNLICIII